MGAVLNPRAGIRVAVANGEHVISSGVYCNTSIVIDMEPFFIDLFTIPFGGLDVVLGVQWLGTLGPVLWDFKRLQMSFWHGDHQVVWNGEVILTNPIRLATTSGPQSLDLLTELLLEFDSLFDDPTGLPPERSHDHHIHLHTDTTAMLVRPYRYPALQKDELERQCSALLAQ